MPANRHFKFYPHIVVEQSITSSKTCHRSASEDPEIAEVGLRRPFDSCTCLQDEQESYCM